MPQPRVRFNSLSRAALASAQPSSAFAMRQEHGVPQGSGAPGGGRPLEQETRRAASIAVLATGHGRELRPAPSDRPRRALLHLSYSCAPLFGPAMLVTHDPIRQLGVGRAISGVLPGDRATTVSPNDHNVAPCPLARLITSDRAPTKTRLKAQVASRLNQLCDTNLRPR
jgi:hypothetical protein